MFSRKKKIKCVIASFSFILSISTKYCIAYVITQMGLMRVVSLQKLKRLSIIKPLVSRNPYQNPRM